MDTTRLGRSFVSSLEISCTCTDFHPVCSGGRMIGLDKGIVGKGNLEAVSQKR